MQEIKQLNMYIKYPSLFDKNFEELKNYSKDMETSELISALKQNIKRRKENGNAKIWYFFPELKIILKNRTDKTEDETKFIKE